MDSAGNAADKKREDEYQCKDDARTLQSAEEIHADPKRLEGAHKHLKHAAAALHKTMKRVGRSVRRASRKG